MSSTRGMSIAGSTEAARHALIDLHIEVRYNTARPEEAILRQRRSTT